ncbi:MAG: prephenate dehydratase [Sulfuritalea sp.]|nr:prephenate dehydratase [Sulfuritalea sp.]MDP1984638.1 prephenate dehydratase [Sulfuritalea sp.]
MADDSQELGKLREGIDAIDGELLRLINERAKLAHRIGEIKHGNIYRPEREAQVLRRVAERNPGPLSATAAQRIIREVMSACLALEQPLTIAYLGPAGTYSESAARKHFGGAPTLLPCPAIDDVFRTIESGNAHYGVVPIENSTEGAIGRSLDLLLSSPLKICAEINLPIHHNLMTQCDALAGVTRVYSHAQSLAQCHEWLNRNLPLVSRVPVASNAEAARLAAGEAGAAAIAGDAAAELYALSILAANIEDDPNNTTRFVIVSEHDSGISGADRTSLVCSAQNRPGAVYQLLAPFADNGVSMSRLESRPARGFGGSRWEYVFYIDIEGHRSEPAVARALEELRLRAGFVKELGSYPKAVY